MTHLRRLGRNSAGRLEAAVLAVLFVLLLSACASFSKDRAEPVVLRETTLTWESYQYALTDFNTIFPGSFDGESRMEHRFSAWVLENEYLSATLVPEFGGRIISLIYKPTGHEQLYRNPLGVPYQIDTNVFYYNWLMVYGGIFPTFPEPEHGKTWFMPWTFEVVEETEQSVTVAMSYTDDSENKLAPHAYNTGVTGLKVTFFITLQAGRAALDTQIRIENPGSERVRYEYWTNTTLAPGSDPADPRTTDSAEIIAPVHFIKIPSYWQNIAAQEKRTGLNEVYEWDALREFRNWADMGIAYAYPNMGAVNFWGVINHENEEGIFRIADNSITPGLKIWTWGFPQTATLDPQDGSNEARPYIELWAGVTQEFWQRTQIGPQAILQFDEIYSPSVGLSNVTHATSDFLVNFSAKAPDQVLLEVFSLNPGWEGEAVILLDGDVLLLEPLEFDPATGSRFEVSFPHRIPPGKLAFALQDASGSVLFSGDLLGEGE